MTTVLSIDPGREKCGLALVSHDGVALRMIVPRREVVASVVRLVSDHRVDRIIVGNGTGGKDLAESLASGTSMRIDLVDERHSSERARARYFRENPPRGLRRLIPLGLQTPPQPYDDYVAVILAEDYLRR